ncbi:MAG: hypothetical protein HYU88_13455, partial [Chloroflexi bacterium]|nr:hypothetical protein [Chloroflexota bacterium]
INEAGQVVGWLLRSAYSGGRIQRPFLWEGGTMRDLGAIYGDLINEAHAVNNAGLVAGLAITAEGKPARTTLWYRGQLRLL